jgi:D-serine deaminase-like pyridoxal phosphate-dependent protein
MFIVYGKENFPNLFERDLTFNTAGSMTYQLYKDITLVNDIAAGSGLVKPGDFDLDTMEDHEPALFIATPVLKKSKGLKIPYIEFMTSVWGWLNPNWENTFFIYGGYWKAEYHQPEGLCRNPIYGYSSNQEIATGSERIPVGVDDYVFLRPRQSEAVMLQFGDLVITRQNKIIDRWPVFRQ